MNPEMTKTEGFNQLIVDLGMEGKVPFSTEYIVNSSPEIQSYQPSIVRRGLALVAIGATLASFGLGNSSNKTGDEMPGVTYDQVDPNVDSEVALPACNDSWAVRELDNSGHRVVGSGVESIGSANTPEDAKAAANNFIEITKSDPDAIKANAKAFLGQDIDKESLSEDGCMTEKAVLIVNEISSELNNSIITPDQAPADGVNSGVNSSGEVVSAKKAGIKGNRKAIKIIQNNGVVTWIMERCGNFVKKVKIFTPGPTDNENPELPPSTTTYVPTTTSTTTSKESTTSSPSTTRWESTTTINGSTTTIKGTTTIVSPSTSRPAPSTTRPTKVPKKINDEPAPGRKDVPADQDKGISDKNGEGKAGQDRDEKGYIPTETTPKAPPKTRKAEQAPTTTVRPPATTAKPLVVTSPPQTATTTVNNTIKPQTGQRPVQP